jgi:hypothetical protein
MASATITSAKSYGCGAIAQPKSILEMVPS